MYGDRNPSSGLRNKVKRWHLSKTIDVTDPITGEVEKKPVKSFMINQLTINFERDRIMLSPWDEVLIKQLTDYEVVSMSQSGQPVYTSKDEHFCDAMALAHLAFVLEFKELTNTIKDYEVSHKIKTFSTSANKVASNRMYQNIQSAYSSVTKRAFRDDDDDLPGDKPTSIRIPLSAMRKKRSSNWGRRGGFGGARSMW